MAKLILSMDGLVLKEIPLSKERTTIGRKAHNDIQIDNLAVSGEHAVIVTILNDSFMEDLGSTNGTLVNGNPVKKHFLQNNDVIELGKYKLKFIQEQGAQPAAAAADFEKTMVLRPSAMKAAAEQAKAAGMGGAQAAQAARVAAVQQVAAGAAAAGVADKDNKGAQIAAAAAAAAPAAAPAHAPAPAAAPAAPKSAQPLGAIQLLSGGNAGKELELSKPLTTLGKPGVQVAVLTRRPQGYFITHVEGAQRPTVNGQAIGTAPHALKDHDLVEIAGIKMEFFHKN
jgi:pSer/pThr/pTyr-binding forkhead associated (FHA) protein